MLIKRGILCTVAMQFTGQSTLYLSSRGRIKTRDFPEEKHARIVTVVVAPTVAYDEGIMLKLFGPMIQR